MTEEPTDWVVQVILDRGAIVDDITKLVHVLGRQRISYTVSASSGEEAIAKAAERLKRHTGVQGYYVKALNPRRMPTGVS